VKKRGGVACQHSVVEFGEADRLKPESKSGKGGHLGILLAFVLETFRGREPDLVESRQRQQRVFF